MSTISFSGLSSGLDTESIISSLMEIEQEPITRLEEDQEYLESRLEAYKEFDSYLNALQSAANNLDSKIDLSSNTTNVSDDSIGATASSTASAGTYSIQVLSLAKQQKDVTAESFSDKSTTDLSGSITIGEETLTYENASLSSLVDSLNDGDYGVTASIINDGSGYRMVLTADQSGTEIDISATGSIALDTATDGHTQESSQAHIVVDNIDIYSDSNVIDSAIHGVTLDLYDVTGSDDTISLTVSLDTEVLVQNIASFVNAYNDVIHFISDQEDADWGNDADFRSVQRKIQNLITTQVGSGNYSSLAALGLETDYLTGEIAYDSATLGEAINSDFESVSMLFLGNGETEGIASRFSEWLDVKTNNTSGMLAAKEESTASQIDRIEDQIERLEARLEKRQESLEAQFSALETLLSDLNSQSDYLTTWIENLNED